MEFFTWDESKKIKQAIVQQGRFVFAVLEMRFDYSSYVTKVINRINVLAAPCLASPKGLRSPNLSQQPPRDNYSAILMLCFIAANRSCQVPFFLR